MADERTRKFFSGRSVEQAVVAAANYHGIDPSEVDYREIEKRHGFVRTRRNAVIAVDPDHPRKAAAPSPKEPPREARAETRRERRPAEPTSAPGAGREPAREREAEPERAVETKEAAAAEDEGAGEERPAERPRRERGGRGGRGGRRGGGEGRHRDARSGGAKGPTEAAAPTPPWWLAEPVEETTEREPEEPEESEESEELDEEEDTGEVGSQQSAQEGARDEAGGGRRGERFRHVRRSEGLRRRSPAEDEPAVAGGAGEERRGGDRPRGRGRRGRGPEAAGAPRPRGGRGREAEPPPPPAPPEPRIPRSERLPREEGELADAAREALGRLLDFVGVEAEADFYRDDERLEIELWGPDDHVLLEEEGQLLLAIEHLLPRMIRGIYGDALPVRVDCNDFHADREERLRELARRTADEVRRRGRARTLGEMDPAERRIVHISLEDDPTVTTESLGDGFYKKLRVLPA